jgi:hypothetical protein
MSRLFQRPGFRCPWQTSNKGSDHEEEDFGGNFSRLAPDYEEAYFWFSVQRHPPEVRQEIEKQITPDRAVEIREKANAWTPDTNAPKP